jgi:DNA-directed RNA polymerase specialized sigma24 family protein/anti-sigma-K factor RskA
MSDDQAPSSVDQPPSLVRVASDELLVLGTRLHDDVALGVLYDRYGAEIYALALGTLHDPLLSEAVMQDVFMRCWRGEELYNAGHGTISDWLLGIARRRAVDTLDARDPDGEVPTRIIDDSGLLAPEEPDRGARDRLLTRARAENDGDRVSEAPTVAVPADDLVSDEPALADVPEDGTPTHAVAAPDAKVGVDTADTGKAEPSEQDAPVQAAEQHPPAVSTSEALAAALAPIPPRRAGHQQRRPAAADQPDQPARSGRRLAPIFWGVALLFVIGSGLFVGAWSATGPHVSPDVTILSRLPGGRVLALRGTGAPTASARVHTVDSGRRAELSVEGLPTLPSGRVYQVWLAEAGQPAQSVGVFLVNRRGDAVMPLTMSIPLEQLQAIFITLEPAPGTGAPSGGRLLEWTP